MKETIFILISYFFGFFIGWISARIHYGIEKTEKDLKKLKGTFDAK